MAEKMKRTPLHYKVLWGLMADPDVQAPSKCVATVMLLKYRNHQTGLCNPSFTTLANCVGRKRRSVIDAVNDLKANGWLKWEGTAGGSQKNTNNFEFLMKETGAEFCTRTGAEVDTGAEFSTTGAEFSTLPVQSSAHDLSIEPSSNHSGAPRRLVDEEEKQRVRAAALSDETWDGLLKTYSKTGQWSRHVDVVGPDPASTGCRAPRHLLAKYGLEVAA